MRLAWLLLATQLDTVLSAVWAYTAHLLCNGRHHGGRPDQPHERRCVARAAIRLLCAGPGPCWALPLRLVAVGEQQVLALGLPASRCKREGGWAWEKQA